MIDKESSRFLDTNYTEDDHAKGGISTGSPWTARIRTILEFLQIILDFLLRFGVPMLVLLVHVSPEFHSRVLVEGIRTIGHD